MSNINGKKVWAVMCGAIRNDFELYAIVSMLCEYRSKGLLEGIVLSTWKNEVENVEGLRDKLKKLSIYVIESDSIDMSANQFVDIGFLRQAYQLKKGLDVLPDDVFVLKCRTDLCIDELRNYREVLEGKVDMSLGQWGAMEFGLHYRIAVNWLTCNTFFALRDVAFIGYKLDLMKITTLSMTKLKNGRTIPSDFAFFVGIFSENYPIINEIMDIIFLGDAFDNKLRLACKDIDKDRFALPEMLNKLYALQYVILYNCFYHSWVEKKEFYPEKVYLSDVVAADSEIGMGGGWLCRFINRAILKMILYGQCVPTVGYMNIYREIVALTQRGYAERLTINKDNYDEMRKWLGEFLKVEPAKWMKPWVKLCEYDKENLMDFSAAYSVLIDGEQPIDKSLEYLLKYMVFSKKEGFYGKGVNVYNELNTKVGNLQPGMLACIGRSERTWVKQMIAKKAISAKDDTYAKTIGFVFERWGGHPRLYTMPFLAENISALYFYGICQERMGKDVILKNLYTKLCQRFGVMQHIQIDTYTSAVYELMKTLIENRFKEYETSVDIRNLVDFWADEMDIEELSESAKTYLYRYMLTRQLKKSLQVGDYDAYGRFLSKIGDVTERETITYVKKIIYWYRNNQDRVNYLKSEDCINMLSDQGLINRDVYYLAANIKNSYSKENFINEFMKTQKYSDEDYQLICKLLSDNGVLMNISDQIKDFADSTVKKVCISLFSRIENDKNFKFFTIKNKSEYWINYNYTDDAISKFELDNLAVNRNDVGTLWPMGDVGSLSPLALYLKPSVKGVYASIEFCAVPSLVKSFIFKYISENYNVNEENMLNRIKIMDIVVDENNSYDNAITKILDEFSNIGEKLQSAYKCVINEFEKQ